MSDSSRPHEPAQPARAQALRSPVIITGGASGIGLASARCVAEVGRPVALWDIAAEQAAHLAWEITHTYGVPAVGIGVDLRDWEDAQAALDRTRTELGRPGALVHSAGTVAATGIAGITQQAWDDGLNVHLRAFALLVQAMRQDLCASPGAAIVAISSINATLGNGMVPIYSAAKGGLLSLVRSLADELGGEGIRVNSVSPGMIETPMLTRNVPDEHIHGARDAWTKRIFLGRLGQAAEVGNVVRFLLSSEASYITAAEIVVDGGNIPSQRF